MTSTNRQLPGATLENNARRLQRPGRPVLVSLILLVVMIASSALATLVNFKMGEMARLTWFFCGGLAFLLIWLVNWSIGLEWLSAPLAYAAVFWMFHFGMVFPASVMPSIIERYDPWNIDWVYDPETGKAVLVSLLFLASFLFGTTVSSRIEPSRRTLDGPSNPQARELVLAGGIVQALAIATFGLALLRYGVAVFFQSYGQFFQIHNSFTWSVVLAAYGLVLRLAGGKPPKAVLQTLLWTYLPLAALTFIAGARTGPLFSAVVLGVAFTKRGLRLSRVSLWALLVAALLLIGVVRQTRQYGLAELVQGSETLTTIESPIAGMSELGGSLRPLSATINYIDTVGNSLFLGKTYVYPIVRQVEAVLGIPRGNPETEPRFIATHISLLYGAAMGYSVAAEGYVNGGVFGAALFALLWGLLLATLNNRSASAYGLAILGGVLLPMMISVRNSFIFVPAWIFLAGLVLVVARYVLRRPTRESLPINNSRRGPKGIRAQ